MRAVYGRIRDEQPARMMRISAICNRYEERSSSCGKKFRYINTIMFGMPVYLFNLFCQLLLK